MRNSSPDLVKKKVNGFESAAQAPQDTGQLIKDKYIAYFSSDVFLEQLYGKKDDKDISSEAVEKITECAQQEALKVINEIPEEEFNHGNYNNRSLEEKLISEIKKVCGSEKALKDFLITEISTEKYREPIYRKYIANGIDPLIARSLSDCVITRIIDAIMDIPTDEMDPDDPFKYLKENLTQTEMNKLYYECRNYGI